MPRRIGDHDIIWWAIETGFYDAPASSLPHPAVRLAGNVQSTGARGGHDLHYRTLQRMGVTLLGHFLGADGRHARFAADLAGKRRLGRPSQRAAHEQCACGRGRHAAGQRRRSTGRQPFSAEAPDALDLSDFGAVIFASGFRPDYASWVRFPGAFDEFGFPIQHDGASTLVPGLYFIGAHFLRKRKSSLLIGVTEDAGIVAHQITQGMAPAAS